MVSKCLLPAEIAGKDFWMAEAGGPAVHPLLRAQAVRLPFRGDALASWSLVLYYATDLSQDLMTLCTLHTLYRLLKPAELTNDHAFSLA